MRHRRWLKCSASNACMGGLLPKGWVQACDCLCGHVLDGVFWPLFGFDIWAQLKCWCMRPSTRSVERKSCTCASSSLSKIGKSSETIIGRNICEAFKVFRVLSWECSHRYWLWNCSDFKKLPCVSCVLHDNHSKIVWSSNATPVEGKALR